MYKTFEIKDKNELQVEELEDLAGTLENAKTSLQQNIHANINSKLTGNQFQDLWVTNESKRFQTDGLQKVAAPGIPPAAAAKNAKSSVGIFHHDSFAHRSKQVSKQNSDYRQGGAGSFSNLQESVNGSDVQIKD